MCYVQTLWVIQIHKSLDSKHKPVRVHIKLQNSEPTLDNGQPIVVGVLQTLNKFPPVLSYLYK
jgi:hypothetical protein